MIPYAEWSSRLLIALFRCNCVLAFIARVEQLPMPSVQMEDEHWAYAQRAKDIPHNTIFKHINGEAFCAGKAENCLFVWSSTPVAHLFGSDPNKWCDGAWANRLWIRTCDSVCLPASQPACVCVRICACVRASLVRYHIFIYLFLFVLLFRSVLCSRFWENSFLVLCFSFFGLPWTTGPAHIQSPHDARRTHAYTSAHSLLDASRIYSILGASHKILMARQWPMDVIIYYIVSSLFTRLPSEIPSNGLCSRHRQNRNRR